MSRLASSTPRIAFLGIGLMGAPMARRLQQSGYQLTLWNRTRAKAAALEGDGVKVAENPAEAVAEADLVISILENGTVVESVLFGQRAAQSARIGTLFIDMSSIDPAQARSHARQLSGFGSAHLDAPVSGGPNGAEKGELAIMVGGDVVDFARAEQVLKIMGRPTLVGRSGAGQFAKLTSQMIASTAMSAVAEALLLAQVEGIDPLRICEALTGGFADSKILQIHGRRMVKRDFVPGGHVHTFLKDLTTARKIVASHNLRLPTTAAAFELFQNLAAEPGANLLDIASMALEIEARNPPHRIGFESDQRFTENSLTSSAEAD